MANKLANTKSLYLKQHAENPVDWWPWCGEAFEEARITNKLILVSIGYSSCHWCHVMARESFEDAFIASLMNQNFICIKVDREEHPEVDQMFMEVVQMITGRGGWPLNVFCLPNGKPFFGGTYFPSKDIGRNIIPWPQLLVRINEHFKRNPQEFVENAENITKNLLIANTIEPLGNPLLEKDLLEAAKSVCATHDDDWGGFGNAPKFPSPTVLEFLLAVREMKSCQEDEKLSGRIDQVIVTTLKGMAHGGLFDQIGGGFARYSVDRFWMIPHFEKMLYDNALLAEVYSKAWSRYPLDLFKSVVDETIAWLDREMKVGMGFAASLDAESGGGEGRCYVWNQHDVIEILGKETGDAFCEAYGIKPEGNFENGYSVPVWVYDDAGKRLQFKASREKLLMARMKRPQPNRDSKVLLSWNSLMIKALVNAGFYFKQTQWLKMALDLTDWLWSYMADGNNRLKSIFYDDGARLNANLDDYTYYAEACLAVASKVDLIQPGLSDKYIKRSDLLIKIIMDNFGDSHNVGFFFTAKDQEGQLVRKKYWFDHAIYTGNAALVHLFRDLFVLNGDMRYAEELEKLRQAFSSLADKAPNGIAYALAGFAEDVMGVVQLKFQDALDMHTAWNYLAKKPYRKQYLLLTKEALGDKKYQLCIGTQCLEPSNDLEALLAKI